METPDEIKKDFQEVCDEMSKFCNGCEKRENCDKYCHQAELYHTEVLRKRRIKEIVS